ncbi:hypothetical protein HDU98_004563, partial [Podochytrium sp. JEL0797]
MSSTQLASPTADHAALDLPYDVTETRDANVTGATLNGQYVLEKVLGRGSYGTVHLAHDTARDRHVAIKELDAKKLKRRQRMAAPPAAQPGVSPRAAHSGGFRQGVFRGVGGRRPVPSATPSAPASPLPSTENLNHLPTPQPDPIDLVREEIAIMKKLQHPNIVRLYEVLHDPNQEIIYMVYELVDNGTLMDVSLDSTCEPLSEEDARFYFRQLILAIEYLHEHDIAHRDIKPDNLLINKQKVLKIVDFGVSEIFSNKGNDKTSKSEGSPAFFAPELCVPRHGEISAKAVDLWAMGVTLYCLTRGKLPFTGGSIVDLYEDVKNSNPQLNSSSTSDSLADLLNRLLDKNPATRITMDELR